MQLLTAEMAITTWRGEDPRTIDRAISSRRRKLLVATSAHLLLVADFSVEGLVCVMYLEGLYVDGNQGPTVVLIHDTRAEQF